MGAEKTVFVRIPLAKIHKGFQLRPHLLQKHPVPEGRIVLSDTQQPEQRVVHNGIDMLGHRVIAPQSKQGALFDIRVRHQKAVYEEALIRVAAPDPFIPLDTINKKGTAAQLESMLCHFPNAIKQRIITTEFGPRRNVHILVDSRQRYLLTGNIYS